MSQTFTFPQPTTADLEVIDGATRAAFNANGHLTMVCEACEAEVVIIHPNDDPDLYAVQGILAEHLADCDRFQTDRCRNCGEDATGGEGYDGYCGDCADRAEKRGEWGAADTADGAPATGSPAEDGRVAPQGRAALTAVMRDAARHTPGVAYYAEDGTGALLHHVAEGLDYFVLASTADAGEGTGDALESMPRIEHMTVNHATGSSRWRPGWTCSPGFD